MSNNYNLKLWFYVHVMANNTWSHDIEHCTLEKASFARRLKQPAVFPILPFGLFK